MNDIVVQALIWIAAGVMLVLYLKRRRNRKRTNMINDRTTDS